MQTALQALLFTHRLCGGTDRAVALELAAVAEYMHVATLIHDDIVDNAATRRGRPSANVTWGPAVSVLAGDRPLDRHGGGRDRDFRVARW